jgi:hypothetical protein
VEFAVSGGAFDFVGDNTGIDELIETPAVGGTDFEAFGVSVVGPFTITATGPLSFISGNATVSLLSDPMAQIQFAPLPQNLIDELDVYLVNHGFILDGFSFQAGTQVPEPATLSLVCTGFAALGGLAWGGRWRKPTA